MPGSGRAQPLLSRLSSRETVFSSLRAPFLGSKLGVSDDRYCSDGFPQATTVGYANDGLDLYFCCDRASQKVRNLRHSGKVSLTIDHDTRN